MTKYNVINDGKDLEIIEEMRTVISKETFLAQKADAEEKLAEFDK